MYLYIHKTYKNEDEQTKLLEVCSDACISSGNGKCFQSITKNKHFKVKVADRNICNLFIWSLNKK